MDTTTTKLTQAGWTWAQLELQTILAFEAQLCDGGTGLKQFDDKVASTNENLWLELIDASDAQYYGMPIGDGVCTATLDEVIRQCALATTCAELESISRDMGIKFFEWQSFLDASFEDTQFGDTDCHLMYIVWYAACVLHVARVAASL